MSSCGNQTPRYFLLFTDSSSSIRELRLIQGLRECACRILQMNFIKYMCSHNLVSSLRHYRPLAVDDGEGGLTLRKRLRWSFR